MTASEFEAAYAARSGVTAAWLHSHGRYAEPCDCSDPECDGWAMGHQHEDAIIEDQLKTRTPVNTYPTPTQPQYQPPMPPPRRRMSGRKRALIAIGAIFGVPVVIAFVIAIVAVVATSGTPAVHRDTLPGSGTVTFTPEAVQPVNPITAAPAVPQYSVPQEQAIASAKSYLESEPGFSRDGLIAQLDSKYGEGFSKNLAVFAVNHVKVNWFQQAVYSARSYMQTEPGWSYSGLVDQLHSPYGAQFTLRQAEYGAHKVGL